MKRIGDILVDMAEARETELGKLLARTIAAGVDGRDNRHPRARGTAGEELPAREETEKDGARGPAKSSQGTRGQPSPAHCRPVLLQMVSSKCEPTRGRWPPPRVGSHLVLVWGGHQSHSPSASPAMAQQAHPTRMRPR